MAARVVAVAQTAQASGYSSDAATRISAIVCAGFLEASTDRERRPTRREFERIQLLADAAGQVLPREEIYQRVWGLRDGPRNNLAATRSAAGVPATLTARPPSSAAIA